ncbi:uncharacterized protein LOC141659053 [Apium graveolens]|uniref:uncharacterized protein LOC141659053 n=1 Tax=Apium graveolens TaxID=4045 RepID=UPI003D7944D3
MASPSPFFSSYWNQPSESRSYSPSSKRKPETASPKVISIPVHFVGSQNSRINSGRSRSDSAVMIQKVFRSFLLRKSVRKIVSIKNQVEEIGKRLAQNETVELIRKDSKERLRINETLMALLFKLDSIRGIRDLRKGVIKKAIALQEKVDSLVMLPGESENEGSGDLVKSDGGEICGDKMMPVENSPAAAAAAVSVDENVVDSMEAHCVVKEIVEDCNTKNSNTELQKQDEEMDDCSSKGVEQQAKEDEETETEMGEKMISEEAGVKKSNEEELQTQMIRMMSELVEKNETQTRMINSLTHRVAQLEKALLCDKLRRSNKKKKRQHDAAADGKQQ